MTFGGAGLLPVSRRYISLNLIADVTSILSIPVCDCRNRMIQTPTLSSYWSAIAGCRACLYFVRQTGGEISLWLRT